MITKSITRYIDLAFCLIILPAMIMLLPVDKWLENDPKFVLLLLAWLYANYALMRSLIVPYILGVRKQNLIAIGMVLATLVITHLLAIYKIDFPLHFADHPSGRTRLHDLDAPLRRANRLQQQGVWFLYVVVTTFSFAVSLLSELNKQIMARQRIEFEHKRAELSLYKAQINPHFLFNTLNTLLGLVVTKSERAEDAIVQFTSLMRYMCDSSTREMVSLHTEIEYIEEYIALQRYRLSEQTNVHFASNYRDSNGGDQIAPMLLITFVENAIKYGSSSQFASDIEINIDLQDSTLTLSTKNPIFPSHKSQSGAGIGITNCRKRLELLYPNRYSLQIKDSGESYEVILTIKLKQ